MADTPNSNDDKAKEQPKPATQKPPTKPLPLTKEWADNLDKQIAQNRAKAKVTPKKPPRRN